MFLDSVPKGSARFLYIFFWTIDVWACKFMYDSTLLKFCAPVLGGHEEGFYGVGTPKMYLDSQVVVYPLEPSPS